MLNINKIYIMKKELKQNIFNYIIYILETFYTEDFSYLKWWGVIIFYPFFILKNIIITPVLLLFTPVLYWYFNRMKKIDRILQQLNKTMIKSFDNSRS